MNYEKENNTLQKYEGYFDIKKHDILGNAYPTVKNVKKNWAGKILFSKKLLKLQKTLDLQHNFTIKNSLNKCVLCDKQNIGSYGEKSVRRAHTSIGNKQYTLKNMHWNENLIHYILQHNYKPSNEFMEFILGHYVGILSNNKIRLPTLIYTSQNKDQKYVKIDRNQLQILDALMNNGGWTKKYEDNTGEMKYSEHAGVLLFNNDALDKIIVSGKSTRISDKDDDIFLPSNMMEAYECEYIFHTHPPTPYPGGRINNGILYELPGSSDIAHFIEHSVIGITRGSLVIAPEGLYNIKIKNIDDDKYMFTTEKEKNNFVNKVNIIEREIQHKAISKFDEKNYFEEITKTNDFLTPLNDFLDKYNLQIDYYPRIKNKYGTWILNDVYLPKNI